MSFSRGGRAPRGGRAFPPPGRRRGTSRGIGDSFLPNLDFDGETDDNSDWGDNIPTNGEATKTPDTETKTTPLEPHEVGMTVGYKQLYSGKEDRRGRFQWQTEIPQDVGKPAENAESEKWAIIVRHIRVYNNPKKVLSIHSIVVQSPLIKEILEETLKGYPGVTVNLKRLEFSGR